MPSHAAIAFDIDGVFKYGREWSENGLSALQRVSAAGMSFVFVTNGGGGLREATYGQHLREKVVEAGNASGASGDMALPSAEKMVLSYTPWATLLAPELKEKRVLLVGDPAEKVKDVAAAYGLKHAVHYTEYAITNSTINPFRAAMEAGTSHTAVANKTVPHAVKKQKLPTAEEEEPFAAVLVMCDPYLWYEAMQVAIDALCSSRPLSVHFERDAPLVPIHFSNPDFLSKFEHPYPRFAQGAFRVALKALYIERLDKQYRLPAEEIERRCAEQFQQWGKPTAHTFRFVERRLRELLPHSSTPPTAERFYMVGDNPASDMEGARCAQAFHAGSTTSWTGVLVRTGVYKEGDDTNEAAAVVDGVADAVDWILAREASIKAEEAAA